MRRRRCPQCRQTDQVVRIIYGMPSYELFEQAERGEVALGGCVVGGVDPRYLCRRCDIAFAFSMPDLASAGVAERGWIEWRSLSQ